MSFPLDCITQFVFVETGMTDADVILIPGASQPQLMETAASLYKQGFAPFILPSGGASQNLITTEWEFLRDVAIANDVPAHAILKEDKAQNTFENARLSLDVLRQAGIQPRKVIIVCKSYHSRRVLLTYQMVFPKETEFFIAPIIDRTGITRENWFLSESGINMVMTEMEKISKYFRHLIPNRVGKR